MTTFSTAPRGYDREEVDAHVARLHARLDDAITEMVSLRAECDDLRSRLEGSAGPADAVPLPSMLRPVGLPAPTPPPPPVDPATVHPPLRPHPHPHPHPHPTRSADRARRRPAAGPVVTALVWLVALVVAGLLLL